MVEKGFYRFLSFSRLKGILRGEVIDEVVFGVIVDRFAGLLCYVLGFVGFL